MEDGDRWGYPFSRNNPMEGRRPLGVFSDRLVRARDPPTPSTEKYNKEIAGFRTGRSSLTKQSVKDRYMRTGRRCDSTDTPKRTTLCIYKPKNRTTARLSPPNRQDPTKEPATLAGNQVTKPRDTRGADRRL